MDTPAAIYHVARDGQVIGAFPFPTLAAQFKSGAVKPTDHYLVEGTTDWKLIAELASRLTDHLKEMERLERERVKAELARIALEKERQRAIALAAKEEARKAQEAQRAVEAEAKLRREHEEELARQDRERSWQCLNCKRPFKSDEPSQPFPPPTGVGSSAALVVLSALLGMATAGSFFSREDGRWIGVLIFGIASLLSLVAAIGQLIAYGVERGLQQFNSYRPRCPNCSSPYCSKQGE